MTNLDFTNKCINVAQNILTRYAVGGWGQPLTEANKTMFINNPNWSKNATNATIRKGIETATSDYFAMDCVCGIKSILDGFVGDKTKTYGGATYGKPCPDITVEAMLKQQCTDISSDMNNILLGEFLTYANYSHCGIYVGLINGKRMVAESTYGWNNGFQLVDMDCSSRKGMWKYHGKLWNFMDYSYKGDSIPSPAPSPSPAKTELQNYTKEIQDILVKMNKIIDTL